MGSGTTIPAAGDTRACVHAGTSSTLGGHGLRSARNVLRQPRASRLNCRLIFGCPTSRHCPKAEQQKGKLEGVGYSRPTLGSDVSDAAEGRWPMPLPPEARDHLFAGNG